MTRPQQTDSSGPFIPHVNVGWIHPFLEILEEAGVRSNELLKQAGLPVIAVDDESALVPTTKIYDFVALARRATKLDSLGFQAGNRVDIEALLPGPERTWTRPGVFRSIRSYIDVALSSSSNVDLWIETSGGPNPITEFFYLGTFGPDHPAFQTVEQFMVALMVRWVRYGAGVRWNPGRINLRASTVPQTAVRELAGEARVRCGQRVTSIAFPLQDFGGRMDPVPKRSSPIWRRHRRWLEGNNPIEDLAGSLRIVLPAYLPDGSPDIRQAAELARMSVRTLQRRLREQGLTYSQLLEELRHDLAIYFLRDPTRDAAEISRELGYRDPAIFTRAFRRWTGTTPSKFRSRLLA